jgi:hypothetical protein
MKHRKLPCNRAMGGLRRTDAADPIGASPTDGTVTGVIASNRTNLPADGTTMVMAPAMDGTVILRAAKAGQVDLSAASIPTFHITDRETATRRASFAPDMAPTKSSACCTTCKRKSLN